MCGIRDSLEPLMLVLGLVSFCWSLFFVHAEGLPLYTSYIFVGMPYMLVLLMNYFCTYKLVFND